VSIDTQFSDTPAGSASKPPHSVQLPYTDRRLKGRSERPTPIAYALRRVLELLDLRERMALCLLNVRGDENDPEYWRQKARDFLWAAPRAGDFHGRAATDELVEQWQRCQQLATLCNFHADLLEESGAGE
jgi:hypothetical protein